ncbi:MAG: hypothetical protein ABJN65_15710 [Parasphingorhabdus sp.]
MSDYATRSVFKKSKFTSRDALEKMDTAEWPQKAIRWAKKEPTHYREVVARLPNKSEFGPDDVELDDFGNITDMPLLIGKPCFGIPTAFLRHGGKQSVYVHRQKKRQPSRCMKCNVRLACEKVCLARIKLIPEMKEAIQSWQDKGGRKGLKTPVKYPKCDVAMQKIARLTKENPFQSSNDERVREHYKQKKIDFLEKDRLRKRRARARALKAGRLDDDVLDYFDRCRFYRLNLLREECRRAPLPPKLRHLDAQGMMNTTDVFLERSILLAEHSKVNPSVVAKRLMKKGKANGSSHNVLRARVSKDLQRIQFLESSRSSVRSGNIWPKFNVTTEIAEYTRQMSA